MNIHKIIYYTTLTILLVSSLVLVTFAAFQPSLGNGFVNWDDDSNFLENIYFRGLGGRQVRWAFATFHMGAYQPLGWLLASAQYHAFGMDARGYHAVSLGFHIATTLAVLALTTCLLRRTAALPDVARWAALGTCLYAVHPLRVEPVAWVSSQSYLPCAFMATLSVLAYLWSCDVGPSKSPRVLGLAVSWLLFLTALLFKAAAAPLPAVLLVLDAYPLGRLKQPRSWLDRPSRVALIEKLPFFLLSAIFLGLAYLAKSNTFTVGPAAAGDRLTRLGRTCYAVIFYLSKTLFPLDVRAYYTLSWHGDWDRASSLAAILGLAAVIVALVAIRRRRPGLAASLFAFFVLLTPAPSLVSLSTQFAADRYTYLPAIALVPLASAGLAKIAAWPNSRLGATGVSIATLTIVLLLAASSRNLSRTWKDSGELWRRTISSGTVRSVLPYGNLAEFYKSHGQTDAAIAIYRQALAAPIEEDEAEARAELHMFLASCLMQKGLQVEASLEFAEGYYEMGRISLGLNDRRGVRQLQMALELNPAHERAKLALDAAIREQGVRDAR